MTLDEEAAKAIRGWLEETGIMYLPAERNMLHAVVAAFGRRCAEQMREEIATLPVNMAKGSPVSKSKIDFALEVERAIRRVSIEGK